MLTSLASRKVLPVWKDVVAQKLKEIGKSFNIEAELNKLFGYQVNKLFGSSCTIKTLLGNTALYISCVILLTVEVL